jgi:tetratricopeptide (TPR) repeat protein
MSLLVLSLLLPSFTGGLERQPPAARSPFVASTGYQRAIALDLAGRWREALALYEEAGRDPRATRARYHAELSRGMLERLEEVRRFPQNGRSHFGLGVDAANKLTALRRETGVVARSVYAISERAFRAAERLLPGESDPTICLAGMYAEAGERARARATIATIRGRSLRGHEVYNLACYYHSMGEHERALRELGKVINDHYRQWIRVSDDFWRLRGDPRLIRLLRDAGPAEGR